jgi:1,4-dihydroxy-2-naphthoate octaprenyltransferase
MKEFKKWYVENYPQEAAKMGKALVVYAIMIVIALLTLVKFPWYCCLTIIIVSTVIYQIRKFDFNQTLDKRMDEYERKN